MNSNKSKSAEREEKMEKIKELSYDDIVMSDKELGEVVNDYMKTITDEEIMDMINKIFEESEKEEPGVLRKAPPITKILYSAREMYSYGFVVAVYFMNETMKTYFEQ